MGKFKVLKRTIHTFFNIRNPHSAHLCVTQRCNLKCRFCQLWKNPPNELSTEAWKNIIYKLEKMGVAVLVFTGGEPLLRQDICELINYAQATGLFTTITSNGINSQDKYDELLHTAIHKISISLDGIDGEDLPYSHTSKKILDNIEFVNKHKGDKIFTINTVLFDGNKDSIIHVIKYCEENGIKIFVQPIVAGSITDWQAEDNINASPLRRENRKVDPGYLDFHNVLNPKFFNKAAAEYSRNGKLIWNCYGGELFFDIKPNGEFWICQDYPTTLNITDPDFDDKWKVYDFDSERMKCKSGCIYSCYYLTQKGLKIKNLPAMIKLVRNYI